MRRKYVIKEKNRNVKERQILRANIYIYTKEELT